MDRRTFLSRAGCAVAAALVAGSGADALVEPHRLRIHRLQVQIPELPPAFDGLRIGQLTDLHHGPTVTLERIQAAVRMLNDLAPDVVALTGDYCYHGAEFIAPCIEALGRLVAPLGRFGVLGNHDYWDGAEITRGSMVRAGILDLTNSHYRLCRGADTLVLAGLDDLWEGRPDLGAALDGAPPDAVALLLSHNPDTNEQMNDRRVKLMLAGHTHGGQINLPLLGPPVVPSRFGRKYAAGLVRDDWKRVYVSRGVGTIRPALRYRCRPEVTLLVLRRAA